MACGGLCRIGSAELNELMATAQQANADLGAAIARVKQADAQLRMRAPHCLPFKRTQPSRQQIVFPTINGPIPYTPTPWE